MNSYNKVTGAGIADWAATAYATLGSSMPNYAYIGGNQSARYSAPMSRAMVAYAIADIFWRDEITEGGKYYEQPIRHNGGIGEDACARRFS